MRGMFRKRQYEGRKRQKSTEGREDREVEKSLKKEVEKSRSALEVEEMTQT